MDQDVGGNLHEKQSLNSYTWVKKNAQEQNT